MIGRARVSPTLVGHHCCYLYVCMYVCGACMVMTLYHKFSSNPISTVCTCHWRNIFNRPPDVSDVAVVWHSSLQRKGSKHYSAGENGEGKDSLLKLQRRGSKDSVRERTARAETRSRSSRGEGAKTTLREKTVRTETLQQQH